jgi:hypothetical protein
MFRRVREAARRGSVHVKSLLASVGRGLRVGALYLGIGAFKVVRGVDVILRTIGRVLTWAVMSAVEVYSISESPFTWVLGNVLFWLLRGLETIFNKLRGTHHTKLHDTFPAFTILNAVAINNLALYPLVALVGWVLSPLTGQNWWRNLAHGYKVRTMSAADFAYQDRFYRDLAFDRTMGEPADPSAWEMATEQPDGAQTVDEEGLTAAQYFERQMAEGWRLIYPDPNLPHPDDLTGEEEVTPFDYLTTRIREQARTQQEADEDAAEFNLSIRKDTWGRYWAMIPDDYAVSTQPPPRVAEPEEHLHAKHAAGEPIVMEPVETEEMPEVDEHGLINYDIHDVPDNPNDVHDPKERSFWYGAKWADGSIKTIKNFLTNTEKQNRARALLHKETMNPTSGYLVHYALKGFDAELARAQEAASHNV